MKQLPTAEEILNHFHFNYKGDENSTLEAMREFAKLHVKTAIEAAAENASVKYVHNPKMSDYNHETAVVDKESILNSYPDGNII